MSEDTWHMARLIPTSGINGAEEQERRAASALLAVMSAVKEFGRALTQPYGAPVGQVRTYIEVPFSLGDKQYFPDGLIRVVRGQREWTALVEVKTGSNKLQVEQVERYLDIALEQGFDALITISNEMPPAPDQHPTTVDGRKLRKVNLYHLPWTEVLTEAIMQKEFRGIADVDQSWILGELIRYLEHQRSGAMEFNDMGPSWVSLRESVAAGTLRPGDVVGTEVAGRFDALVRYVCLWLGRRLGLDVTPDVGRRGNIDSDQRMNNLVQQLTTTGSMTGAIRIPNAAGSLHITADLRAGRVTCHLDIAAPRDRRSPARINWLLKQLQGAPDSVRVEAYALHARGPGTAELLGAVRANPGVLIEDPNRELKSFRVALSSPAGTRRSAGRGAFIDSVLDAVDAFYRQVVQNLRPWMPAPPRLRPDDGEVTPVEPVASSLISTGISSQDGPVYPTDSDEPMEAGYPRDEPVGNRDSADLADLAGVVAADEPPAWPSAG